MNPLLVIQARDYLKKELPNCTKEQVHLFKRMYSHNNLELPIDDVVDNMEEGKLDRAMDQVRRTVNK